MHFNFFGDIQTWHDLHDLLIDIFVDLTLWADKNLLTIVVLLIIVVELIVNGIQHVIAACDVC